MSHRVNNVGFLSEINDDLSLELFMGKSDKMHSHSHGVSRASSAQMSRFTSSPTPGMRSSTPALRSPIPWSRNSPTPRRTSSPGRHTPSPLRFSPSPISRPSSVMSRNHSIKLTKGNPMKCSVCTNRLDYQWILPGLHNFCTHCLEDYILRHSRGRHCHCPICKAGIRLPKGPKQTRKVAKYPRGTDLVVCDVCEDKPAFYKCSECNEYFCETCNKMHLRMRMSQGHHVAYIKSIRAINETIKTFCKEHAHEELKFHCRKCDVPICRDCKVLNHEGHLTAEIEEVVEERKQRVEHAMTTARGHLARLKAEAAEVRKKKSDLEEETNKIVGEIRLHANKIKDVVDSHADSLVAKIKQQLDESMVKLDKCNEAVKEKLASLQSLIDTAAVEIDTSPDVDFVNSSRGLEENLRVIQMKQERGKRSEVSDSEPYLVSYEAAGYAADCPSFADKLWRKRQLFQKGDVDEVALEKSLGDLKTIAEGLFVPLPAIELQIESNFSCDQNYQCATSIAPLPDGTAWVCNGHKNKLQLFDTTGRIWQTETLDYDVDDMTALPDGTILVTEYNGKVIRKLGVQHHYFARSEMYLRGITTSRDGETVIVCANDVPVFRLKDLKSTKLFMYNIEGHKIKEITIKRGLALYRICHTINDDFVVSTGLSMKYMVVDAIGQIKNVYTASGSADGVACDVHGLVILTDFRDDTIHLLDSKGKPMPYNFSLNKPNAVAVDVNGYIWIGDWNRIRIMKYM